MGACSVIHPRYGVCDCTLTKPAENRVFCETCFHPLDMHSDYSNEPGEYQPSDISPRTETVSKLASVLDHFYVVHVRGTPSSGKTTLATLLKKHYQARGLRRVALLTGWTNDPERGNPLEHLASRCRFDKVDSENVLDINAVYILDGAHATYNDLQFWLIAVKAQSDRRAGAKICLFSSYGSPTTGSTAPLAFKSTPLHLGPAQRVSLTVSQTKNSPDVALFYNAQEYEDVIERLCSRSSSTCELSREAKDYLFAITSGHAGATMSMVTYVYDVKTIPCLLYTMWDFTS